MNYSKIKQLLIEKNISIGDLVNKIGITHQGFNAALKNESLKVETIEKIAEFLEVDVRVFFGGESETEKSNNIDLKELEYLKELIREKDKIIDFLERDLRRYNSQINELVDKLLEEIDENYYAWGDENELSNYENNILSYKSMSYLYDIGLINFIRVESKKLNQNFSILQVDNQWIGENKLNRKSIPKEIVKSFESSIMQKDFTKEEWM